ISFLVSGDSSLDTRSYFNNGIYIPFGVDAKCRFELPVSLAEEDARYPDDSLNSYRIDFEK
ncbi:MAG: hypothetical protein GKC10_02905, partial [Methanosarcinales archaeon]|nr:hypothetical protein [Methanosarcinales archaeon]